MTDLYDLDAERYVIGCCLIRPTLTAEASAVLDFADFSVPTHGETFAALVDLWRNGRQIDAHTLTGALNGSGMSPKDIASAMASVPATSHVGAYARTVAEFSARRSLVRVAGELAAAARSMKDPGDVIDQARAALESVDLPAGRVPDDLQVLDDLLDAPVEDRSPWVVEGLLRQDWRVIVVAPEGQGKTALLFQCAIAASQGVHPLTFQPIDPVRVLIVDLENPEERIVQGCVPIRETTRLKTKQYDRNRAWLWHRPGGIDLRARADIAAFEAVLSEVRPQLVVMGPAYKASQRGKGEGWDESAMAVQRALDSLRTRFSFALLMEDHAPQSSGGVRDLRPFGSSLWLRWPEIGLKLAPEGDGARRVLNIKRWRGDRLPNDWPIRLEQGDQWPWVGVWDKPVKGLARDKEWAS